MNREYDPSMKEIQAFVTIKLWLKWREEFFREPFAKENNARIGS
jgi:hypothetical protein